jgi:Tol biopolymer transport system component
MTTAMVDVGNDGAQGGTYTREARVSGDGSTVVFATDSALNVLGGTRCTSGAVYLRHLNSGTTTALMRPDGSCITGREPDISYDGTRIAFWGYTDYLATNVSPWVWQIYLYDTTVGPGSLSIVSASSSGLPQRQSDGVYGGEGISTVTAPAISQDGRFVAFRSRGYGLWPSQLPLDGNSVVSQVYVKNISTAAIDIASVDSTGTVLGNFDSSGSGSGDRPGLSSDGQYIVFHTSATNISTQNTSGFVLHNNFSGGTVGLTNTATNSSPDISPNGRFLTIYSGNPMDPRFSRRGMFLLDTSINGTLTTRYRLYSETTKEHLYTTDLNEYNTLPVCCNWKAEGSIYQLFLSSGSVAGVNAVPYYRLYNRYSYQHHWTTDANEYNALGAQGWSQEGIDGYVLPAQATGSVPLYRLYLNASGGLHLWTTDANEKNVLTTSAGWKDEGIAGYVMPLQ